MTPNTQESNPDPIAGVRFYDTLSGWNWYAVEFDEKEKLCFGLVIGFENELGYFSLIELEKMNEDAGFMRIRRDDDFTPSCLSQLC